MTTGAARRTKIEWELRWDNSKPDVHTAEEVASENSGVMHRVVRKRFFAMVRSTYNSAGYFDGRGYVVARTAFDDVRCFGTLEEAKLYVESLYALEQT